MLSLQDVIENINANSNYYQTRTMCFSIRTNRALYQRFVEAGRAMEDAEQALRDGDTFAAPTDPPAGASVSDPMPSQGVRPNTKRASVSDRKCLRLAL